MSKSNTLGTLLDLIAQLEDTAYDFYGRLRQRHADNPEAMKLLSAIMDDELLHARVVHDIIGSMSEFSRQSPVSPDLINQLEETLKGLRSGDEDMFTCSDDTCDAIEKIEALEFDVVLSLINVPEVNFNFSTSYARNQAVDHTNKVYRLLRALD
ncbi:hypothetical protein [uncultured Pseudodesulfovibrio sp.]|uniref:hypothetical protein n=1 Tax=uncultured Pseudodesulfovibrio sp. TaxID=2035858 RepID=UPI0029C69C7A|nr:hypothetical protein [uncultured Pseudodesulfovibrio sp.]